MWNWDAYKGNLTWLKDRTIFLTRHGSHAYGTNIASSDEDFKGFCIPTKEYFLGFHNKFEQAESHNPDFVIYDIRKFFNLASDCNPSIMEVLWTDPEDWITITPIAQHIVDNRDLFLSQKAKHTFSGYAVSQLKKIKSHRNHLLNPPTKEPLREDFGLPRDRALITKDQAGAMDELLNKGSLAEDELSTNFLEALAKEKAYLQAKRGWDQYQEWKKSRNPARSELEARYGYDTKHGMHLCRLMRMCREILEEGKVLVKRPDAEELLAIRGGAWSYEKLIEWAETQDRELDEVIKTSKLPHSPNRKAIDELCIKAVESML